MSLPSKPTPTQLVKAYSDGLQGWIWNEEEADRWEEFTSSQPSLYTLNPEMKDLHKTRSRALLYLAREAFDKGAYSQESQTTGDCTSHGSRTARDTSRSVEILNGEPEQYYLRTATEPTYGMRGHAGQGMSPTTAAKFEHEYGFLFRKVYKDVNLGVNIDLTKYNAKIGINWGRSGTPSGIKELCKAHSVGAWLRPKILFEALDLLAAGKAGHSGQQWGTYDTANNYGINETKTRDPWNHDMGVVGYDLSRECFREAVVFIANSWGVWNNPNPIWVRNEHIYGPWIPGMIVITLETFEKYFVNSGSIHFYSDILGFPIQNLPYLDIDIL